MDKDLTQAMQRNDLAAYITALYKYMHLGEPLDLTEEGPAPTDEVMIAEVLKNPRTPAQTTAIISGIGKFKDTYNYITERQRTTVIAMYDQWGKG